MAYIAPGVRTKVIRNARAIGGDTPYQIPVIIGAGNDIFKHSNIKLTYDGTDVTYVPTSSGLTTVAFSDSTRPHCIEKIGLYADAKSYTEGYDYVFVSPSMIVWLPGGNRPDKGASIYVTFKAKAPVEPTVEGAPLKFAYTMVPRGSQPVAVDGQIVAGRWFKMQTAYAAQSVRDAAIAMHPEALYLYGGSYSNGSVSSVLQRMMPVTEAWLTITGATGDLPGPKVGAALCALNNDKLVLFGGSSDGTALSGDTFTFDVAAKTWTKLVGTAPAARKNHRMVNVGGKLYVFGGVKAGGVYCDDVWCFDGIAWTDVSPTAGSSYTAMEAPCAEVQDGQVYLFGGRTGLTAYSNALYRIDVSGAKAAVAALSPTGSALPAGRAFAASGIVEGGLWIFGGSTAAAAPKSDVWRYDITGNTWKLYAIAGAPKARAGAASETYDGIVYIVGGANGTVTNGETWQLDPYLRDVTTYEPSDVDYLPSESVIGVISVQSFDGMTTYKVDVDYVFEEPNQIRWLGTTRPTPTDYDDPTTFYRVTYTALKTDTVDTDPFAPTLVADLDQVDYMLGDDFCSDGRINEVKLATQLCIRGGANLVYYLQVRPSGDAGGMIPEVDFVKALERLEALTDAYTLVPLTTNPVVLGSVLSHVQIMSSWEERKERKMFGTWADPVATDTIRSFAKNIRDFRMSLIWPGTTTMTLSDGKLHVLPGYYLAAALAGDESRGPVYRSQTNCTLSGIFTELCGPKLKRSQLDYLAAAGVYICEQEAVGFPIHIRHSLTTDMSLIQTKENSLITVADYISKYMRQVLKSYIGGTNIANSPELQARIRTAAEAAMDVLKAEGTIMGGSVRKLTNPDYAPDTILLDLDIIPPYPCNYINVTIYL